MKALKAGSVSQADVIRAKQQLKIVALADLTSNAGLLTNIQSQALLTGQVQSAAQILAAIEAVTVSDVNAVSFEFFSLYASF